MRPNNLIILFVAIVMGGIAGISHAQVDREPFWRVRRRRFGRHHRRGGAAPWIRRRGKRRQRHTESPWIASSLPNGAFVVKEDLLKDGRRVVLSPLEKGEPILRSKITGPGQRALLSSLLDEGKRAVTLRVDDVRGVSGSFCRGISSTSSSSPKTDHPDARTIRRFCCSISRFLRSISLRANGRSNRPSPRRFTSEVTPSRAQKLLLATNIGKLSLILRRPEEADANSGRRVTERGSRPDRCKDCRRSGAAAATTNHRSWPHLRRRRIPPRSRSVRNKQT